MSGSLVLLHLAGAVALLLWATRMVRTGVERAYGDVLRLRLRALLRHRVVALLAGAVLAVMMQSATAVSLLIGSFAGTGIVSGTSGLVAVFGADLGSALVVRLLSLDLFILVPICLVAGTSMFLATESRKWRQIGRILIGIGLLILSLRMIGEASEPLRDSALLPVVIGYLAVDPVSAFIIAAIITWLFHSSVAAVLLVAALAARDIVPADLGLVLVLGANLGGSVIAAMLSRTSSPASRIVPVGNLILRGFGAVMALAGVILFAPSLGILGSTVPAQLIHAHILFNAALALVGLPLAGPIHALASRMVANGGSATGIGQEVSEISALSESALDKPAQALANATREVMRVCETVEIMLNRIGELYVDADEDAMKALAALDDRVDRSHAAIKLYLARMSAHPLSEEEALRCQELVGACVKLEQVGDIIVRNLLVHVRRKHDRGLDFTDEGWRELSSFHAAVSSNARLAFNLLVTRDPETARQIVLEKDRLRDMEKRSSSNHFARLRDGTVKSMETSTIHLDTIRDLKQINSLLASIAYPILEERGLLRDTRLKSA